MTMPRWHTDLKTIERKLDEVKKIVREEDLSSYLGLSEDLNVLKDKNDWTHVGIVVTLIAMVTIGFLLWAKLNGWYL